MLLIEEHDLEETLYFGKIEKRHRRQSRSNQSHEDHKASLFSKTFIVESMGPFKFMTAPKV